jgi:hypothetical protein
VSEFSAYAGNPDEWVYVYRPYAMVKYNSATDEFSVDWDWSESLQGYTDERDEYHDEDRIRTPHLVDADIRLHQYLVERNIRD